MQHRRSTLHDEVRSRPRHVTTILHYRFFTSCAYYDDRLYFNDLFLFLLTLFLEETFSIAAGIGVGDGEEERVGLLCRNGQVRFAATHRTSRHHDGVLA
jgi:hypothetical protein